MGIEQLLTAQVIVEAYLQVLNRVTAMLPFGAPDALLPHSRDEIRRAICDLARQQAFRGLETDTRFEELRTAYYSLASFVAYEEANLAARLQDAIMRYNVPFLSSAEAEAARNQSRRIERDASRLMREFDAWISEQSDPLLKEVDAVLANFQRKPVVAIPR